MNPGRFIIGAEDPIGDDDPMPPYDDDVAEEEFQSLVGGRSGGASAGIGGLATAAGAVVAGVTLAVALLGGVGN